MNNWSLLDLSLSFIKLTIQTNPTNVGRKKEHSEQHTVQVAFPQTLPMALAKYTKPILLFWPIKFTIYCMHKLMKDQ